MKKILLLGPFTDKIENPSQCMVHYPNIGDILIVHAVRNTILDNFPMVSISFYKKIIGAI